MAVILFAIFVGVALFIVVTAPLLAAIAEFLASPAPASGVKPARCHTRPRQLVLACNEVVRIQQETVGSIRRLEIAAEQVRSEMTRLPTDLADALATSRSLGAAFHVAHQFRDQLPPAMRAAFDANARSRVCFQLGAADAKVMAAGQSVITAEDFTAPGRYEVYASLVHHGTVQPWASGVTVAPPTTSSDPVALRRHSRSQYGQTLTAVEAGFAGLLAEAAPDDLVLGRRPRESS